MERARSGLPRVFSTCGHGQQGRLRGQRSGPKVLDVNVKMALTISRGPKRKCTSSEALGFSMCFLSLACRGSSDRHGEADELLMEESAAAASHQEVEGQLQFLQAVDELCLRGGLGSQGQHALCGPAEQQ